MAKKKSNTLTKILYTVGLFLSLFIVVMIITFWKYQSVPDTLIVAVLGAGGIQSIACAFITIKNWKKYNKEEE